MMVKIYPGKTLRGADKFGAKRAELAGIALNVIAEQGFAHTGLRDVAARTELSHGVLHYYFENKDDLIAQAIWSYKSACARRYDVYVETSRTPKQLLNGFSGEMARTLRDESDMHRLWYDLRNQSLFGEGFRATIITIDELLREMVWAIVKKYAQLSSAQVRLNREDAYALFDGLFLNSLIAYVRGDLKAIDRLVVSARHLLASSIA